VGGVVFLIQGLVPNHGPSRSLHDIDIETLLFIKAHGIGHDDRSRTGNRNEADIKLRLFKPTGLRKSLFGQGHRENG